MSRNKTRSLLLSATFLSGCSAALAPYSSNPYKVFANADSLLESNRPLAAERLILDAVEMCKKNGEPGCFAAAHRSYGMFFMSDALNGQWKGHYMTHGFRDASATYGGHYTKAIEYLNKVLPIAQSEGRYDAITNLQLNIGFAAELNGDRPTACKAYDDSLAASIENWRLNPNVKVVLPEKYETYENYIEIQKDRINCNTL